jgi:hypothetical protein
MSSTSAETVFWNWFRENEDDLFHFERRQEAVFDAVGAAISLVHRDLTFEFGPVEDRTREFVISGGGIIGAFPAVESLYAAAPQLARWRWTKFRPRRSTLCDLQFGSLTIRAEDVRYLLARDGAKIGILLFLPGYREDEEESFGQAGYLFLDEALGEFTVETQVGFIEINGQDSKYFERSSPLVDLPAHFDEVWRGTVQ